MSGGSAKAINRRWDDSITVHYRPLLRALAMTRCKVLEAIKQRLKDDVGLCVCGTVLLLLEQNSIAQVIWQIMSLSVRCLSVGLSVSLLARSFLFKVWPGKPAI